MEYGLDNIKWYYYGLRSFNIYICKFKFMILEFIYDFVEMLVCYFKLYIFCGLGGKKVILKIFEFIVLF